MGRKRYTPERIIRLLRKSEVLSSEGRNVPEICREIGVTVNTYYRWGEGVRRQISFYSLVNYMKIYNLKGGPVFGGLTIF